MQTGGNPAFSGPEGSSGPNNQEQFWGTLRLRGIRSAQGFGEAGKRGFIAVFAGFWAVGSPAGRAWTRLKRLLA
jgi:hypothetical protein